MTKSFPEETEEDNLKVRKRKKKKESTSTCCKDKKKVESGILLFWFGLVLPF